MINTKSVIASLLCCFLSARVVWFFWTCEYDSQAGGSLHCLSSTDKYEPYIVHNYFSQQGHVYNVNKKLECIHTSFQFIEVFISNFWGKIMTIDGDLMTTERDETHYHEAIVHSAMVYLPEASDVLIIGGGDGGSLREVLRYKSVTNATLVDIDKMVIKMSEKYFANLSTAFSDPRAKLFFEDGANWVYRSAQHHPEAFDLIIIDSTDFGQAVTLFTDEFYLGCKRLLKKGGIMTRNFDSASVATQKMATAHFRFSAIFKHVYFFQYFIPTYTAGHYSFVFLSDAVHPFQTKIKWEQWSNLSLETHYYNKETHYASFILPTSVNSALTNHISFVQLFN